MLLNKKTFRFSKTSMHAVSLNVCDFWYLKSSDLEKPVNGNVEEY